MQGVFIMGYQSEAELENQLIKQLNEQGYKSVVIKDYDGLLANFRECRTSLSLPLI